MIQLASKEVDALNTKVTAESCISVIAKESYVPHLGDGRSPRCQTRHLLHPLLLSFCLWANWRCRGSILQSSAQSQWVWCKHKQRYVLAFHMLFLHVRLKVWQVNGKHLLQTSWINSVKDVHCNLLTVMKSQWLTAGKIYKVHRICMQESTC